MNKFHLSSFFLLYVSLTWLYEMGVAQNGLPNSKADGHVVDVGVVLDLETWGGKMSQAYITMALSDFYAARSSKRKLALHMRDSNDDVVGAADEVLDLLKKVEVKAIIGPQTSAEADFAIYLGTKAQVPIISFSATSPTLNPTGSPYFIRTTIDDSAQVRALSAFVRTFGWREVVPIYENSDYGNGLMPFLADAFEEIEAAIPYRSVISTAATDDQILTELYKLMSMESRVFVVHMSTSLGSRLFLKVAEIGMMSDEYAWIITDGLTDFLDSFDSSVIESMQGVIGVKSYIPRSKKLKDFTIRWKRKILSENPSMSKAALSISGLRAYDTVQALAMAVDRVGAMESGFQKPNSTNQNSEDLRSLGVFQSGPKLLEAISKTTFMGLSGEFRLVDGEIQPSAFQIINVVGRGGREIGFWTPDSGLSRVLRKTNQVRMYSASAGNLKPIIWPGDSKNPPRGWVIPTAGNKLRIGVPIKRGFNEFVNVVRNSTTNATEVTGFCIDVFDAVRKKLPYATPHEFVPFEDANGNPGSYNDLIYQVYLQKLDMVVGDMTIVANRSLYVDFTLPYSQSGVSMVVPAKDDPSKNAWIFLKPLSRNLWLTSCAGFAFTGFVVWMLEHRINEEFRGPSEQQLGVMFWFSFSTLVFAHKERVYSNLSRLVVIIWVFVVLVLTSSYTASLTSMLTVQKLQPTVTDVEELIRNGDYVGYQQGSFVGGLLNRLKFDDSKLKAYGSPQEYADALSKGSSKGGVAAIFDEIPYNQLFIGKYCGQYLMAGRPYRTDGFAFAFPIDSPLAPDFSRAILTVTESDEITRIEDKWFGSRSSCNSDPSKNGGGLSTRNGGSLTLDSFWGLFVITGSASTVALLVSIARFLYQNWNVPVTSDAPVVTFGHRLAHLTKRFFEKDLSFHAWKVKEPAAP